MDNPEEKKSALQQRLEQIIKVTQQEDQDNRQRQIASQFMQMMDVTRKIENDSKQKALAENFAKMMQQTKSFDSERERLEKAGETAISDAFARMIQKTHQLEQENKNEFDFPPEVNIEFFPSAGDRFFHAMIKKLPKKVQRFPSAFRRNPRAVIKYFAAMVLGRILAITLYVVAAFIPALPVPESVVGVVGRAPSFLGSALTAMRGAVVEFSPQAIMAMVANIPTDINKLIQKVGEFFQYYGRRFGRFFLKGLRHPKWAFREIKNFMHGEGPFFWRLFKGALGVAFSFFVIKLSMIFLLPLFGGIAITVLGFKVSIILVVIVRMAISSGSEILGKILGRKIIVMGKFFYNHPEEIANLARIMMDEWMREWSKNNSSRWIKVDNGEDSRLVKENKNTKS